MKADGSASRKKRRSLASGITSVAGAMIVGFDEQVLRTLPRVEILVKRGRAVRGLSAQGGTLIVGLPDDPISLGSDSGPLDEVDDTR